VAWILTKYNKEEHIASVVDICEPKRVVPPSTSAPTTKAKGKEAKRKATKKDSSDAIGEKPVESNSTRTLPKRDRAPVPRFNPTSDGLSDKQRKKSRS
jgi:hypothetical protein